MSIKEKKAWPETGWGMPFVNFFDPAVEVDNRARNGRSTKSFLNEKLWQPVLENLKEGDYVLIQFGHNDEVPTKRNHTTEQEFRENLIRYVNESRSKKAIPVLITPVARRKFDAAGKLMDTHAVYSAIVRSVAADNQVPLIDLDRKSQALLQKLGPEGSVLLYNHLEKGENPNYPDGQVDDTHFNELGARRMAELVLSEITRLNLGLADRIIKKPGKQ
jgi:lysophospholipase L1-like esterase